MTTPRIRSLYRQANRVADSGKRSAAEALFRDLVQEAPDFADGWAGLGRIVIDPSEKESAIEKALAIDPTNKNALREQAILNGETFEEEIAVKVERFDEAVQAEAEQKLIFADETDEALYCYRHPETETALRCNRCDRPICIKCANRTSVGYRCPECIREIEDESNYYTATTMDYIISAAIHIPIAVIIGYIAAIFGGGFFFWGWIIAGAVGPVIGRFAAQLAHRAVGRRRGRYMPRMVSSILFIGILLPSTLALLLGAGIFALILPAILATTASSAAFVFLR